jgi:septum formation protein
MRCAGAFAIDGRGSLFIEKLEGCHTNVIGLSMPLLRQLIDELGYSIVDFWSGN